MKKNIEAFIGYIRNEIEYVSEYLYQNPETGNNEYKALELLTNILEKYNFKVEKNFLNIGTEFRAVYGSGSLCVAFLCEYDALPQIGHGCGHNMIAAAGIGAAIGLSTVINEIGGKIVVLGTPAEETNGAKVKMADNGVFNDIDAALMIHPSDDTTESGNSLALDAVEFTFIGKSAHAAANPEQGINALNACIETFNLINALRQHVTSDVRIHGIITEGGIAANIVPEKAVAQFYIRSAKRSYLNEVVERVKNCAKAAAMGVGADVSIKNYELSYDNMITNSILSKLFSDNLRECGITDINPPKKSMGSLDMGNVSHILPAIHPYIKICEKGIPSHSRQFASETQSELAKSNLIKAACAMAYTGYDIIVNKELLKDIKREFKKERASF